MAVPFTFGSATAPIPLANLDSNFATPITLGNTAIQLGNTVTTLNNMTLANATVSSGNVTVTSASLSGNLTFTGTGNRITGDFSNATFANRVMFQSSTTNGNTAVSAIPNGTGTIGQFQAFAQSDPTNASKLALVADATNSRCGVIADTTGTGTYLPMTFYTGGSESMRIDTSGNVGIGTSSPAYKLDVNGTIRGRGDQYFGWVNGSQAGVWWAQTNYAVPAFQGLTSGGNVGDICMQPGGGNLLVGVTSTFSTVGVTTTNTFSSNTATTWAGAFQNKNATTPCGVLVRYDSDPNGTSSSFVYCQGNATLRAEIRSNGGLANFSANNVNLSDERTKTDIQDAESYLAKICAIPVRTFKYKDQSDDLLNLGVIAQEVEKVAPELVDTSGFGETPEDGIPLKAIYQTDMMYALMKAIQEQQALITQLTERISALEGKA